MAGCKTCGGGVAKPETQIVVKADGTTFEVGSPTEAKIKVLQGEGKSFYAKKA